MARSRAAPAPARSASSAAARPKPAPASTSYSAPAAAPPRPAAATAAPAAPAAPQYTAPPPAHAPASAPPPAVASGSGGGIFSGLVGSMVTGAAMGTGSAIAHRAVDSMFGPRETKVVHEHQGAPAPAAAPAASPEATGPCADRIKAFGECMSKNNGDMGACQWYFDAMQQCKLSA